MNETLREIVYGHKGRLVHKFDHYIDIYEQYFSRYRNQAITILELGISHGGSLQIWKKYFGPQAKIYAIDINPDCKKLEEQQVNIYIGSQEDKKFLSEVIKEIPPPDIVIDDGGHTMIQQITTFDSIYDSVKENGIYLCEDTCTSYWYEYEGGLRRKGTFVEFSKNLIDYLYAWHIKSKKVRVNEFTRSTKAIHFYDSMVIFEKGEKKAPMHIQIGEKAIIHDEDPMASKRTFFHRVIKKIRGF